MATLPAMVRAAVLTAAGRPLELRDDVAVADPKAGEVLLRVAASGVCHSDLSTRDGTMMTPVPIVLGHEGAGVVESVGEGVTSVAPGDHVVVSWVPQCGGCFFCHRHQSHLCERATTVLASGGQLDGTTRLMSAGAPLHQMAAAGTFSELTVIPEISAVKIDPGLDLTLAALLGCAVLTGTGAAMRTATIAEGDCVAVVGCGGVGLNVIQGARIRGAGRIVAVDTNRATLDLAVTFGATDVVLVDPADVRAADPVSAVMALTGQRGADVAFEVIGLQATIDATIAMTRRGGQAVLVGVPAMDAMVNLPAFFGVVLAGKTIHGCWYGSSNVRDDIPALVELYRGGRLLLDELVTRTISLDEADAALDALRNGSLARTVIVHDS